MPYLVPKTIAYKAMYSPISSRMLSILNTFCVNILAAANTHVISTMSIMMPIIFLFILLL